MSSERLPPRPSLRALTVIGLLAAGLGFVGASADPGPGPITVHGSLTVGTFYLPPLLTGLTALATAALISTTHSRLTPAIGSLLAIILLIGSVTAGADAVSYRLTHPEHPLGFTEDWLQYHRRDTRGRRRRPNGHSATAPPQSAPSA